MNLAEKAFVIVVIAGTFLFLAKAIGVGLTEKVPPDRTGPFMKTAGIPLLLDPA